MNLMHLEKNKFTTSYFMGTPTVNPGELCGWLTGKRTFAIIDLTKLSVEFATI